MHTHLISGVLKFYKPIPIESITKSHNFIADLVQLVTKTFPQKSQVPIRKIIENFKLSN